MDSLDLLVLEATSKISDDINVYRRVGAVTIRHVNKESVASPNLIARLEKIENSRAVCLGPQREKPRKRKVSNDVITEIQREPWKIETVIIV